ncbi:type IV pilus assembly protein PilM [Synechococcus sp. PCC 7335]|uniref:type IV pilus assembly protein PilM n=1 Tax=Synechococcus sp. (strain ATCC 29403 / PCC 7335) TaxID=91464 RepID=UPI00017ECB20|nr:type IV pilus assembly protein PilM [Synechococcus sp. PCC 7335]EDX87304.1 type IV pilus assembly protein PilM [Synechococcus sp. PCC 7335]
MNRLKSLFSRNSSGVGIELTPERINIVRLKKQGQKLTLQAFATAAVPKGVFEEGQIVDSLAMAEIIQETLAEHNINVTQAATAIPARAVTRVILVPAELDDDELHEMVLNQEASLYLPFPRDEADVDYQKVGYVLDDDGIEKVRVLLVAVRKEITDSYTETFAQAGLDLNILEASSFALIRTIREQLRQFTSQEAITVVDIQFESTEISIVVDGTPHFSRAVPLGTFQIQSALSRAMNLPPSRNINLLQALSIPPTPIDSRPATDRPTGGMNPGMTAMLRVLGELTDELRRSIDFYLSQGEDMEIAQLVLAGPGGAIGNLDQFFSQRLGLPTTVIDPVDSLEIETDEDTLPTQRSGLATVFGLGLREV